MPNSVCAPKFIAITTLPAFHARMASYLVAAGRRSDRPEVVLYNEVKTHTYDALGALGGERLAVLDQWLAAPFFFRRT